MVNGRKIRALRESKGIMLVELAEAVGYSQAMVSSIESGSRQPSVNLLKAIADYFKCTVDELLTGETA